MIFPTMSKIPSMVKKSQGVLAANMSTDKNQVKCCDLWMILSLKFLDYVLQPNTTKLLLLVQTALIQIF
jgi:hypothetical protein